MRKNLTWFTVEEVYCTTSLEEADADFRPGDAGGGVEGRVVLPPLAVPSG